MTGMVSRIEEINGLAEESQGFVWRLPGSQITPRALAVFEDYFIPFVPERLFYNLSVWESMEDLHAFLFRTRHAEMLRDKRQWIEDLDRAHLVPRQNWKERNC